jgi:phage protein D
MSESFFTLTIKVIVGGQDVTSAFLPRLISVSVTKNSKRAAHTCEMQLADPDGSIYLPQDGDPVTVLLGRNGAAQQAFTGFVNNVSSDGGRGGRKLKVSATSANQKSKVKQGELAHKDDATFKDVAEEWGRTAGLQVTVVGELASEQRDHWDMQNESFQSWGQRVAAELGATFNIEGDRAVFAPRNEGKSASGKPLTPITAAWGDNLLSWSIATADSRPVYKTVRRRFFDREAGEWKYETSDVENPGSGVEAELDMRLPATDSKRAKASAKSGSKESKRNKGGGSVSIVGNAAAQPEARCTLAGTRPGIDGEYVIDSVEHSVSRSNGWETKLTLKLPEGNAGKDGRRKPASRAA